MAFNAGRGPERLTRKYRLLASNPFAFLRGTDRRTAIRSGTRKMRLGGIKALPVGEAERARVTTLMERYAASQSDPRFFKVQDVARRIADTGSLGVERYVVLLRGREPRGQICWSQQINTDAKQGFQLVFQTAKIKQRHAWQLVNHQVQVAAVPVGSMERRPKKNAGIRITEAACNFAHGKPVQF